MSKTLTLAAVSLAAMTVAMDANAAPRTERVTFTSNGEPIIGQLYIPDGVTAANPAPALVVTGAWMTVKEQMPARYAAEMAERGFVALTFDFRGWGESGGVRRQYENPTTKITDIEAAVAYLTARPEAQKGGVGGFGICASSGYMVTAAAETPAIKSVALVAPWLHDREVVDQTYGGAEGVAKLIAAGDAAEADYRRTGTQTFVPAASLTDQSAIMFKVPYYTEADRGMIPAWRNEADPAFWRGWLTFDAVQVAPRLKQPFLMVHSEAAAIPQGAHKFYAHLNAPKREVWLDNVTQLGFYDRAAPVKASADAVAAHFNATLANEGGGGAMSAAVSARRRSFLLGMGVIVMSSVSNLVKVRAAPASAPLSAADKAEIAEAVTGIGLYADLRDWGRVRDFMASQITTDYVSLFGGEVGTTDRVALIAQWKTVLPGFDATQHLITNIAVDGNADEAHTTSHVRATHWINGHFWTVGGIYRHRLVRSSDGWRVSFIGIQRLYEEGDRAVLKAAAERVTAAGIEK